ncbi:MAG TPA: hypothetical protein VK045_02310 [Ornithinicoccus sp.]|nr:hypothetical protein [Ornithinicoccus sp.]
MQRRAITTVLSLVVLTATALSGCTSASDEDESTDETSTTATPTTEGAAPADPDWWCRLIRKDAVDAATNGRSAEAREHVSIDEEDVYQCDVLLPTTGDETEVAMSLSMHRDAADEADARLAEVKAIEGAVPGPDHLGVSYIADTLAVSVMPCKSVPDAPEGSPEVPFVFTIRAQLDTGGAATDLLDQSLTRLAREMDMSVGCSPSKIHEPDDASATTAP